MTYDDRERMFAKDVLSIKDIQDLLQIGYNDACEYMRKIRFAVGDNLGIRGKISVDSYLTYCGVRNIGRYYRKQETENIE